ncbi:chemotaxis protein [Bradyrhizobium sp. LTSP885]|uniref:methyl-accepting chemotaxis protein n=1 Tax=Bradyrhizobium sp. LTSP885 TaxID=1619232 RepID=UPI0005C8D982|nr:HAMP domain-containing methyl-accepting chemotaxis protein [Bradyrhizobium sp. LTSP885]KJC51163.1 chemotaxis protein [Bradyrhizobium sp. LTSP885]
MRISRLFAMSMLSVTVLTVILGTEVLIPQARTFAGKSEAIKAVEAFGTVLAAGQQVAGIRAPYLSPLFQDGPATPAQLETITKFRQATEVVFAKARAAVSGSNDSAVILDGLRQAASKLDDLCTATDRALAVPLSARDPNVTKGFLPGIADVTATIDPILNRLENQVAAADASLTALLNIARTAQDLRVSAGSRAATMSAAVGTRRVLTAAELSTMDRSQGRVEVDRERIVAGIDQLGNPARLTKVFKEASDAYFGRAALVVDKELPAGRSDGKFGITTEELAAGTVPALMTILGLRDVALAEAADRAGAAREDALLMLMLAGAAVLALLGVLAGVTVMLRRRVIVPLATLTESVGQLAAGRHDVSIPSTGRDDEIGSMAGSLQVFKDALIAKKGADEAAALEAEAKIQRGQRVDSITREFEAVVGDIVNVVSSASSKLEASADALSATAEHSSELATTVAAASEQASTNVQSVASATEEMTSSVDEISRQVHDSARIAKAAVEQAHQTNDRVGELAKAAARIGDVVELINTIAAQTNLLALNATIEAARAGDAGRGFAVVASEVKALAEQTSKATDEISQQISGIQSATQESVGAIKEIGNTIAKMSEIASTIASAVEEQGAATREISRNVQQAAHGTQQVSTSVADVRRGASETGASSAEVLAAAKSLSSESGRLKLEVGRFLGAVRTA